MKHPHAPSPTDAETVRVLLFLTSVVLFPILVVLPLTECPGRSAELIAFCSDATYVAPEEGPLPNPGPVTEVASEEEGHDFRVHSSSGATYVASEEAARPKPCPGVLAAWSGMHTRRNPLGRDFRVAAPRARRMSRPRKSGHENRVPLPRRRPLSPGQGLGAVLPRARHMSRPSKMLYAQRTRPDRVREWSFLGRDICRVRAKCYKLGGPGRSTQRENHEKRENHENQEQDHRSQEQIPQGARRAAGAQTPPLLRSGDKARVQQKRSSRGGGHFAAPSLPRKRHRATKPTLLRALGTLRRQMTQILMPSANMRVL